MAATQTKRHKLRRTAARLKRRFYVACGNYPALDRAVVGPQAVSLRFPNPIVANRLRDASLRSEGRVLLASHVSHARLQVASKERQRPATRGGRSGTCPPRSW